LRLRLSAGLQKLPNSTSALRICAMFCKGGKTKRTFSRLIGVDGTVWILDGYECNEVAGC
ncbi:MAG: hypothetical protein K2L39_06875, partial [Muribaculaceae bacterium]|nr:hypothetical protein [Muribaculaceae bacterium]